MGPVIDDGAYPHIVDAILGWAVVVAFEQDRPEMIRALRAVRRKSNTHDAPWRYAAFVPSRSVCIVDPASGLTVRHPWQSCKMDRFVRHQLSSVRKRKRYDHVLTTTLRKERAEREEWWEVMAAKTQVFDALTMLRDAIRFLRLPRNGIETIVRRWETMFPHDEKGAPVIIEDKPWIRAHTGVIFGWPYKLDFHGVPEDMPRMHKEYEVAESNLMRWDVNKLVINLSQHTLLQRDDWDLTLIASWNRRVVVNFHTWPEGPYDDSSLARLAFRTVYLLHRLIQDLYWIGQWKCRPLYIVNAEGVPDEILRLIKECLDPSTARIASRCKSFRTFVIAFLHQESEFIVPAHGYDFSDPIARNPPPDHEVGEEPFGRHEFSDIEEDDDEESDGGGEFTGEFTESEFSASDDDENASVITYSGPGGNVLQDDTHRMRQVRFLTSAEYEAEVGTETYRWETMEQPWLADDPLWLMTHPQ